MKRSLGFLLLVWSLSTLAFDWQGHRGSRGLYPENTIGAMEEALKYPVTTLEFDVVLSKDHKVVVSHEPWMNEEMCADPKGNRVKGKEHNLYKLTYEEIQKYDCGSLPHPRFPQQKKIAVGKPTMEKLLASTEEMLKKLHRERVSYNIEIKSTPEDEKAGFQPDVKTFTDVVMKSLKETLPLNRYTIQSFDWRVLKYLHEAYPDVRLVALLEETAIDSSKVVKDLGFSPYVFSPYFKDLKQNHVDEFHKLGVKVIVWTPNTVEEMKALLAMKIDGIITDYPSLIPEVLAKVCKKGKNLFEGKCIKVPKNALPSATNPGWVCKPGHIQKRDGCTKILVPKNGTLQADGKTWVCDPGFRRYRDKCKSLK